MQLSSLLLSSALKKSKNKFQLCGHIAGGGLFFMQFDIVFQYNITRNHGISKV
jgi:hypothetical protein